MELTKIKYKVVVVDDEAMAVKAICRVIEECCFGFEIVGTAANGVEALDIIQKKEPDLVLADIEMPLMDGLELIHRVKEEELDVSFVIISGYQEFEYARDAIRSGVLDYLTKPIVPSKMLATMENAEEKLKKVHYQRRNEMFRKICLGETIALEEMRKLFPYREFYAALLRENGLPRRYSPAKEPELYGTINESFSVYGRDNMEELFLIPKEVLGEQSLLEYMTKVELRWKANDSYTTLLYYGEPFLGTEISEKVRDLYYWLNTLSTVGLSQIIDLNKKQALYDRLPTPDTTEIENVLQDMERYVRAGKYAMIRQRIEKAFYQWEKERRPQIWIEQAVRRILNFIRTQTGDEESLVESEYQFEEAFYYATNMQMLRENLNSFFKRISEKEKENYKVDSEEFFEQIIVYLKNHLSEPLSLQQLSDMFAISQAYMSKLFRKYTKQSYNQYLTSIRMERAKQIMEGNNKFYIKEIAEMVGYRDQFYFSRIFHSYTGKSPSDYGK